MEFGLLCIRFKRQEQILRFALEIQHFQGVCIPVYEIYNEGTEFAFRSSSFKISREFDLRCIRFTMTEQTLRFANVIPRSPGSPNCFVLYLQ